MTDHLASADVVSDAYIQLRGRVIDLLRATPEDRGDLVVPACPEWTVRQLVGHLVGVPEDVIAGNMEGVTTPAWTAAQVARHQGRTLRELAESYGATGLLFDQIIPTIPAPRNSQMVMDAVTHELDLRDALGDGEARDSAAIDVALGWLRFAFADRLPPGTFDALDAATMSRFDLLRSITGRRSRVEMDALGLDGAGVAAALAGTPLGPPI